MKKILLIGLLSISLNAYSNELTEDYFDIASNFVSVGNYQQAIVYLDKILSIVRWILVLLAFLMLLIFKFVTHDLILKVIMNVAMLLFIVIDLIVDKKNNKTKSFRINLIFLILAVLLILLGIDYKELVK